MFYTSRTSLNLYILYNDGAQSLSGVQHFCNPMDCDPPGSSVHGIIQARILEWRDFIKIMKSLNKYRKVYETIFCHCFTLIFR